MKRYLIPIGLFFLLAACGNSHAIQTTMSEQVPDFEYTTQDEKKLSLDDLEGEWWVANFIFTNCTTVCMPMTYNMAHLQSMMAEEDIQAQLVSFSVDPEHDTPEILKDYASNYDVDFDNWSFVTGYDFETIREFSIKHFKNLVQAPADGEDQVLHGTSFFLVSPEGEVVKSYNGVEIENMDIILDDLKKVN
ncbi:SCO family protein [Oceanobacillus sp. J11TS1]|uniref:SCO family protein n=1 Tax=Oceanobacillus sp. J11TS1 TaxID=2807191 RepID=UPI001B20B15A|nr:SCO family protein [Oceanobacillus sp. J11TS1]GIO22368.1 SCO1 protein [Oceanobacillus sp. J11TS1]